MCLRPLNVAAYLYTPPELRGAAVGLLSLLRNEGGSVGTSMAQTIQERRDQFHTLRLGEWLDSFNAAVVAFLERAQAVFLQQTGDPSRRSNSPGRRSRICASSRPRHSRISMFFSSWPL